MQPWISRHAVAGSSCARAAAAAAPATLPLTLLLVAVPSFQIQVEVLKQDNKALQSRVSVLEGKVLTSPVPAHLAAAAAAEVDEAVAQACAGLEEREPQAACGTAPGDRTEPLCTAVVPDSETEGEDSVQTSPHRSVPGPVGEGEVSQA